MKAKIQILAMGLVLLLLMLGVGLVIARSGLPERCADMVDKYARPRQVSPVKMEADRAQLQQWADQAQRGEQ